MSQYSFEIGTTQVGMTNLESLAVPVVPPAWTYRQYSEEIQLGDGTVQGQGWPTATWHWGFIKKAMKASLKTFCAGKSAVVYIKTYKPDRTTGTFRAVMVWPAEDEDYAERTQDFTIEFRRLEAVA
jgi:hypothetical protein